jgi:hypothetical protein
MKCENIWQLSPQGKLLITSGDRHKVGREVSKTKWSGEASTETGGMESYWYCHNTKQVSPGGKESHLRILQYIIFMFLLKSFFTHYLRAPKPMEDSKVL